MEMNISLLVFQLLFKLLFLLLRMGKLLMLFVSVVCFLFMVSCLTYCFFSGDRVNLVKAGKHQVFNIPLRSQFFYCLAVVSIY